MKGKIKLRKRDNNMEIFPYIQRMKKEKPYIIYTKKNKEQVVKYLNKFNIHKLNRIINKNRGYDPENNF